MKTNKFIFIVAILFFFCRCSTKEEPTEPTIITTADITIDAPESGAIPNTTASGKGNFSISEVSWWDDSRTLMTENKAFTAGMSYTVVVTLTANTNCSFATSDGFSATINGNAAYIADNYGSTVTLEQYFDETALYRISISQSGLHDFGAAYYDYGARTALTISLWNTGNHSTGEMTVKLSGTNTGSFSLTGASITNLLPLSWQDGKIVHFSVVPNTGLPVGTYIATVTVSVAVGNTNPIPSQSFDVIFTVEPECVNDWSAEEETEPTDYGLTISPGACLPEVSDRYVYPVLPGSEEWITNANMGVRLSYCQLPENILKSISTSGLIDALMRNPLFDYRLMGSADIPFVTWQKTYNDFNSAKELFQREDAGNALVTYYKLICDDCIESAEFFLPWIPIELQELRFSRYLNGLDVLFTQQEILDKLKHTKKKEAVAAIFAKCEYDYDKYGEYDYFKVFAMVHIMIADGYCPIFKLSQPQLQGVLGGYFTSSYLDEMDLFVSFAKKYINDK